MTCHLSTSAEVALHSGKFPEDELKAGRELEFQNMLNFDAFELVDMLPPGKHCHDMVCVDEWRGDWVRSRLGVRKFKAEGLRDNLFARTAGEIVSLKPEYQNEIHFLKRTKGM